MVVPVPPGTVPPELKAGAELPYGLAELPGSGVIGAEAGGMVVGGAVVIFPVLGSPERGNWIVELCAQSFPAARKAASASAQNKAREFGTDRLKPEGANDDKKGFWTVN